MAAKQLLVPSIQERRAAVAGHLRSFVCFIVHHRCALSSGSPFLSCMAFHFFCCPQRHEFTKSIATSLGLLHWLMEHLSGCSCPAMSGPRRRRLGSPS